MEYFRKQGLKKKIRDATKTLATFMCYPKSLIVLVILWFDPEHIAQEASEFSSPVI